MAVPAGTLVVFVVTRVDKIIQQSPLARESEFVIEGVVFVIGL